MHALHDGCEVVGCFHLHNVKWPIGIFNVNPETNQTLETLTSPCYPVGLPHLRM